MAHLVSLVGGSVNMSAPPIVRDVYRAHLEHFGEPTQSIVFDDGKPLAGYPNRIDIFIWEPNADCDMTTVSTVGMSAEPIPNAMHRAELHFAVRRALSEPDQRAIAYFLANLAMYPFHSGEGLDWWHTIAEPGDIPLFQEARCV